MFDDVRAATEVQKAVMNYSRALTRPVALLSIISWLALLISVDVRVVSAHPPAGSIATETVAESPAPGVRIIREKNYDKQPANYLSSNLYTTLASGRDTFNKFVAFDFQVTPGGGPLPHTHSNEWETFFVHQGSVTFTVGLNTTDGNPGSPSVSFKTQTTPAGTLVYGPQGPVHGFFNDSGAPARIFSFAMPAGLDNFFVTSGEAVTDFKAPIPPISLEEIERTAFWAEQRGDGLFLIPPGGVGPPPPVSPCLPGLQCPTEKIAKITDPPAPGVGAFGETRVHLLTQAEVGNITGATAFCGPGFPGRPGGSVEYDYITVPATKSPGNRFPALVTSDKIEVFYVLDGTLSFKFGNGKTVDVPELTYVEIARNVPFSIANQKNKAGMVGSLNVKVVHPTVVVDPTDNVPKCPGSFLPPPGAAPTGGVQRTPSGKLPGSESAEQILERYKQRGKKK